MRTQAVSPVTCLNLVTLEAVNILSRQMSSEPQSFLRQRWGSCQEVTAHPVATTEEATGSDVHPWQVNDPAPTLLWSDTPAQRWLPNKGTMGIGKTRLHCIFLFIVGPENWEDNLDDLFQSEIYVPYSSWGRLKARCLLNSSQLVRVHRRSPDCPIKTLAQDNDPWVPATT